jgi:hypothetical protein
MARRAGRRWFGALAVLLVVLAGLFVAVDRIAVGVAQQSAADALRTQQDLPSTPDVRIDGFPFLTQATAGRYRRVRVHLDDLEAGEGLRVDRLDVTLRGVHVPLRDAMRRQVQRVPVDSAHARARIGFDTLARATQRRLPDELKVSFAAGGPDTLRVSGRYTGPRGELALKTTARLAIRAGRLRVDVERGDLSSVPEPTRARLAELLSVTLDLPDLPLGFRPTGVGVGTDGVQVLARGRDLVLGTAR